MEFEIPETLDGLDLDALTDLEERAVAAFNAVRDDPELDADGLARLRDLAAFVASVRERQATVRAEAEQVEQELGDLDQLVNGGGETGEEGEGGEGGEGETAPAETPPPVPVTASVRTAARRQRKPPVRGGDGAAIVRAAADVPDVANGHQFANLSELSSAFDRRFAGFPNHRGQRAGVATRIKQGVAKIELPGLGEGLVADGRNDIEVIDYAASEARLSGGNVIASGGWGAPSERKWDLCPGLETTDGLLDLPTIDVQRGGVQYFNGWTFSDIWAGVNGTLLANGAAYTEAESIAGTAKVCVDIPTPELGPDNRLELDGMCLKQDIVQNAIWPEVTREWVRRANVAHPHKINGRTISKMAAGSTAYTITPGSTAEADDQGFTGLLSDLTLVATQYRYKNRMGRNQTVEMCAPLWLLEWARVDLSRRTGQSMFDVSDEQINSWLARRKIRAQWVYDYQDAFSGVAGGFGATVNPATWPSTVDVLVYAAGTWVKGTRNIIDLSAVYDSTNLAQNEYLAVFTEEATLVVKRCYDSFKVTIPLDAAGSTGYPVIRAPEPAGA